MTDNQNFQNEINSRIADSMDKISDWVDSAEAFAISQAPEIVREILTWGFWSHLIIAIILVSSVLLCWLGLTISIRKLSSLKDCLDENYLGHWNVLNAIFTFVIIIFSVIALPMAVRSFYFAMLAYFAPRLYVIDYIKDLM